MEKGEKLLREYGAGLAFKGLSRSKRYGLLLEEFNGTPYVFGGNSIEQSDCSGSVCAVLNAVFGTAKDVTAESLFRDYFTLPDRMGDITAMFFIRDDNKIVHVCGCICGVDYMNVSSVEPNECRTLRSEDELYKMYPYFRTVKCALNVEAWIK